MCSIAAPVQLLLSGRQHARPILREETSGLFARRVEKIEDRHLGFDLVRVVVEGDAEAVVVVVVR